MFAPRVVLTYQQFRLPDLCDQVTIIWNTVFIDVLLITAKYARRPNVDVSEISEQSILWKD
ncbi:hypothetical protein D3C72_2379240 [compost metagenome]